MGTSSNSNIAKILDYKKLPNDQYVCTYCNRIPELKNIDYEEGIITFKCKNHNTKSVHIKDYFEKESNHLYYNFQCDKCDKDNIKMLQKDNLSYIFNNFIDTNKNFCEKCSKDEKSKFIKVNELNSICNIHLEKYIKYCKECDQHFCSADEVCAHLPKEIIMPKNDDIVLIQNRKNILLKQIEINNYLIKFLDTLIKTYEKHPSNYYNSINIINFKDMINKEDKEKKELLSKIEYLEKKY